MLAELFKAEKRDRSSFILYPARRDKLLEIEQKLSELLTLADYIPLRVALATYAANYLKQIPVWTMIVAPSSSGKTAILEVMYKLDGVKVLSDITAAALLSGIGKKDRAPNATGGLLKEVGELGFFIFKDLTSLLSKKKDDALTVFAALREIYDGDWSRHFGSDGGTSREWHGRIGQVAAVTSAIEKHRPTFSTMGDRFLTIRMYDDEIVRFEQADTAFTASGTEKRLRTELQDLTASLFDGMEAETVLPECTYEFIRYNLISLAQFVALCRTPIEYSSYNKEVEQIHKPEGLGRITKQLQGLFRGCIFIGCSLQEAWEIIVRVAMDSIPEQRATALENLIRAEREGREHRFSGKKLRMITRLSKGVCRRIADELFSLRILDASFYDNSENIKEFWLSDKVEEMVDAIQVQPDEPEKMSQIREDPIPTNSLPENETSSEQVSERGVEDVA